MTEAVSPRSDCAAVAGEDFMVCERCGHEWMLGGTRPPCSPITRDAVARYADGEYVRADVALDLTRKDLIAGKPVDLCAARRRAVITAKIQHIIDVVTRDKALLASIGERGP